MTQQYYYYKLIKPFESNNVYKASSLLSGAGKCFKEVLRAVPDTQQFSILDINTNDIFDFNINPPPISRELISPNVELQDIKELRDKIASLEERINRLENSRSSYIPDMSGKEDIKRDSIASDGMILFGGQTNNNQNNNNLSVKTLSQVNSMKINNDRNLMNKLNNGQNLNVELARKLIN